MRIAVFGLGEAGSLIAADLSAAGAEVHAFDPAEVATPSDVRRHQEPGMAVSGASLVLAVTASADSREAMDQAWDDISDDVVYADLATASPNLKRELAAKAGDRGVRFADVALMAPVPGKGLSTPALASGTGAGALADIVNPLGGRVEALDEPAGSASARKLTRSVVSKGLAGLIREAMGAAAAAGDEEWAWSHIVTLLEETDETLIRRLVDGTEVHAARRLTEMEAVRSYLADLGVPTDMTTGTIESLRREVG